MNPLDRLSDNAVIGFGFLGAFAGQLLGGSAKERTNQIVLYGALGAAAGYFFNKSKEQRAKAVITAGAAQSKAIEALSLASEAKKIASAPAPKKVKVLGGYGDMSHFMAGAGVI